MKSRYAGTCSVLQLASCNIVLGERTPTDQGFARSQLLAIKGILRRDWLVKHRNQRPAVTVSFFDSESLMSDPTSYAHVCQQLDALRYRPPPNPTCRFSPRAEYSHIVS